MMMKTSFDHVFRTVSEKLPEAGIDCLLIGGFAVNYYGYTRNTLDVDFMIAAGDIDCEDTLKPLCMEFADAEIYGIIVKEMRNIG